MWHHFWRSSKCDEVSNAVIVMYTIEGGRVRRNNSRRQVDPNNRPLHTFQLFYSLKWHQLYTVHCTPTTTWNLLTGCASSFHSSKPINPSFPPFTAPLYFFILFVPSFFQRAFCRRKFSDKSKFRLEVKPLSTLWVSESRLSDICFKGESNWLSA